MFESDRGCTRDFAQPLPTASKVKFRRGSGMQWCKMPMLPLPRPQPVNSCELSTQKQMVRDMIGSVTFTFRIGSVIGAKPSTAGIWISTCLSNLISLQVAAAAMSPVAAGKGAGGWVCPACTNYNYPHRTNCNKCGIPKETRCLARREPSEFLFFLGLRFFEVGTCLGLMQVWSASNVGWFTWNHRPASWWLMDKTSNLGSHLCTDWCAHMFLPAWMTVVCNPCA